MFRDTHCFNSSILHSASSWCRHFFLLSQHHAYGRLTQFKSSGAPTRMSIYSTLRDKQLVQAVGYPTILLPLYLACDQLQSNLYTWNYLFCALRLPCVINYHFSGATLFPASSFPYCDNHLYLPRPFQPVDVIRIYLSRLSQRPFRLCSDQICKPTNFSFYQLAGCSVTTHFYFYLRYRYPAM